jgi:glycosyltransferase involved in cell wall biosynthesis
MLVATYPEPGSVHEMQAAPLVSVVMCAHNEEDYVDESLSALTESLRGLSSEVIFVADRCVDGTVRKARIHKPRIIEKKWNKWKNSYAESLQTGYRHTKGVYISIVDADIVVPRTFFKDLLPLLGKRTASVAALVSTFPDTLLNRAMYAWEKTRKVAPLGKEPRGAARILTRSALEQIGGFKDVLTPDTDVDLRLASLGYRSVGSDRVKVYHIRHVTIRKMISGQVNSGRARYALRTGFSRTVAHAMFRLRPLTIVGWVLEWQRHSDKLS